MLHKNSVCKSHPGKENISPGVGGNPIDISQEAALAPDPNCLPEKPWQDDLGYTKIHNTQFVYLSHINLAILCYVLLDVP